jgi:hypothetical protein
MAFYKSAIFKPVIKALLFAPLYCTLISILSLFSELDLDFSNFAPPPTLAAA